jgi:hypothetical protein
MLLPPGLYLPLKQTPMLRLFLSGFLFSFSIEVGTISTNLVLSVLTKLSFFSTEIASSSFSICKLAGSITSY